MGPRSAASPLHGRRAGPPPGQLQGAGRPHPGRGRPGRCRPGRGAVRRIDHPARGLPGSLRRGAGRGTQPVSAPPRGASGRRQDHRRVGRNPAAALHRGRRARPCGAEHPAGAVRSAGGLVRGAWLGGTCARCRTGHHRARGRVRHAAPGRGAGSPRPDADRARDRRCLRRPPARPDRRTGSDDRVSTFLQRGDRCRGELREPSHPPLRGAGDPGDHLHRRPGESRHHDRARVRDRAELGFSIAELLACTQAAVAASFCDEQVRGRLLRLLSDSATMDP